MITQVQEASAAQQAGLEAGDIIVVVDKKTVSSASQLRNAVGGARIGDKLKLEFLREGKKRKLTVKVGERANAFASVKKIHPRLEGAELQDAEDGRGILVKKLASGSNASMSGLRVGDRIVSVNRVAVASLEQLAKVAERSTGKMLVRIVRGNTALFIVLS